MNLILLIAAALMMISPLSYLYKVSKKEVKPSVLSWFGWAVLIGISFVSQVVADGWSSNLLTVMLSALSCFTIAFFARFVFRSFSINKKDRIFLYCSAGCVLFFILFKNQLLTTLLAIVADFMLAVPTLKMAYNKPENEKSVTWPLALLSWVLTLLVLMTDFSLVNAMWPVYLILFNGTMTYFTYGRTSRKKISIEKVQTCYSGYECVPASQ